MVEKEVEKWAKHGARNGRETYRDSQEIGDKLLRNRLEIDEKSSRILWRMGTGGISCIITFDSCVILLFGGASRRWRRFYFYKMREKWN